MDLTGKQLGNYRMLKHLGSGGFADVYLGEQKHLNRPVAVKVLRTLLMTDAEKQTFIDEANQLAKLDHPHIIPIYDFEIVNDVPFFVMAYASNGTLKDHFPSDPLTPSNAIVRYVKQVAEALQFVHDRNLVHRDIKPENILLKSDDSVWLADFGIAVKIKVQSQLQEAAFGTIEYMAPEQIRQKPCAASDQYSLAIIVYAWLCGTLPFTGTTGQLISQHLQNLPPTLQNKNPTLSRQIEKVVLQALEKDPQKRFTDISAFAHAFEQAFQQTTMPIHSIVAIPPKGNAPTIIPDAPPTERVKQAPGTRLFMYKGHRSFVQAVAWSPTDLRVASVCNDQVHIWDAFTGGNMFAYQDSNRRGQIWSITWSPNGQRIAFGTMRQIASIWSITAGNSLLVYDKHQASPPSLQFTVRWSGDSKYVASGGVDKTVQVWDAHSGTTLTTYQGHTDEITSLSWSPDGKQIASASEDKTVHVWDAMTGKLAFVHDGHTREVYAVAWSPDGNSVASASRDTSIHVWNAATNERLFTYAGHERRVKAIAWSPNSKYIASVDDDKIIHVWDVFTGKGLLFCCEGHSGLVNALAWSADGHFLASASNDNTVCIWQTMP